MLGGDVTPQWTEAFKNKTAASFSDFSLAYVGVPDRTQLTLAGASGK